MQASTKDGCKLTLEAATRSDFGKCYFYQVNVREFEKLKSVKTISHSFTKYRPKHSFLSQITFFGSVKHLVLVNHPHSERFTCPSQRYLYINFASTLFGERHSTPNGSNLDVSLFSPAILGPIMTNYNIRVSYHCSFNLYYFLSCRSQLDASQYQKNELSHLNQK